MWCVGNLVDICSIPNLNFSQTCTVGISHLSGKEYIVIK